MNDIAISPVAGWDLRQVRAYGIALLTLKYLVSPIESPDQAHSSQNFGLIPAQLRELAQTMLKAADSLESAPPTGAAGPTN
jgi:hypothetical protein